MGVIKKKPTKKELIAHTAMVHCADTMERYTAYIQLMDVTDADEVNNAIIDWLNDNSGEPEPWTRECYVIDAVFVGVQTPVDLTHMGLNQLIKKYTNNETIIRELSLDDDRYLVLSETKDGGVNGYSLLKRKGKWSIAVDFSMGDYADGMDWLVEHALHYQGNTYDYTKTKADPF